MVEVVVMTCFLCSRKTRYLGVSEWEGRPFDDAMEKALNLDGWFFVQDRDGEVKELCQDCADHLHSTLGIEMERRKKS
jgi:hypothetical protein